MGVKGNNLCIKKNLTPNIGLQSTADVTQCICILYIKKDLNLKKLGVSFYLTLYCELYSHETVGEGILTHCEPSYGLQAQAAQHIPAVYIVTDGQQP